MMKMSICVPTHANFELSAQTLSGLRQMTRDPHVEVVIADNSADPRKEAEVGQWSTPNYRYFQSKWGGMAHNWKFALEQAHGEYVSFVSDDDQMIALPGFDARGMCAAKEVIGIRPTMALFTESRGIYAFSNFEITAARAIDRIKEYFQKNKGANTTLFSAWRKDALRNVYLDTMAQHATHGGYGDWAIVLGLLSEGPIYSHPQLLYVYNNKNWSTAEDIERNVAKTFTDVGLPSTCAQILPVLQALECFALVGRANSCTDTEEKLEAAHFCVQSYYESFKAQFANGATPLPFAPEQIRLVRHLMSEAVDEVERLAACLLIAESWSEGLADRFRTYFKLVLDPAIRNRYFS
jgi:hypothetical protein